MLIIKPYHSMDIIKLSGKGIEKFVPDPKFNHNFYGVANQIINNHQVLLKMTLFQDSICAPCNRLGTDGRCTDPINHINGVSSKDDWNKTLDGRIMEYTKVLGDSIYSAQEYCRILYAIKEHIFDIWREEPDAAKNERYQYFCRGAQKYLGIKETGN